MDVRQGKNLSVQELIARVQSEPVNFYPSTISRWFYLVIAFALPLVSAWVLWIGWHEEDLVKLVVGALGTLLFVTLGVAMLHKLLNDHPTLTLSKQGLTDHHNLKGYLIPWADIAEVQIYTVNSNTLLGIKVTDEAALYPQLSTWSRWMVKLNTKTGFPMLSYPQLGLGGVQADTLMDIMAEFIDPST